MRKMKIIVFYSGGAYQVSRRDSGTLHDRLPVVVFWVLGEVTLRKGNIKGQVFSAGNKVPREVQIENNDSPGSVWEEVVLEEARARGIAHLVGMRKQPAPLSRVG